MSWIAWVLSIIYLFISIMYSLQEGRKRATGFAGTLLPVLLVPFIGYWIIELLAGKKAKGCAWCGNKYHEAEYCGLCGKNEHGDTRPGFISKAAQNR